MNLSINENKGLGKKRESSEISDIDIKETGF